MSVLTAERESTALDDLSVTRRISVADLAERRLNDGSVLALRNVACAFQDGVLTLRGCLPTYYLKQLAQARVADLVGVRRVINEIEVAAPRYQSAWR